MVVKHINTYINIIALVLIGLFILLPSLTIQDNFPAYLGEEYLLYCLLVILFLSGINLLSSKIQIYPTDIVIFLLQLYILTNNLLISSVSFFNESYNTLSMYIALYYCIRALFSTENRYQLPFLIFSILFCVFLQILYGIMQLYNIIPANDSSFIITGSLYNPGPYSCWIMVGSVLGFGIYILEPKFASLNKHIRILSIIVFFLSIIILPSTQSRSAWIGEIIGIIIVLELKHKIITNIYQTNSRKNLIIYAVIILTIIAISVFFLYYYKQNSSLGRILIWKISLWSWQNNPFLGKGIGSFEFKYGFDQTQYLKVFASDLDDLTTKVLDNSRYPFNEYIKILYEIGLLGLIMLLFVIVYTLLILRNSRKNNIHSALTAVIVCFVTFSFTSYPFAIHPIGSLFFILISVSISQSSTKISLCSNSTKIKTISYFIVILLNIVIILLITNYVTSKQKMADSIKNTKEKVNSINIIDDIKKLDIVKHTYIYEQRLLLGYISLLIKDNRYEEASILLEESTKGACVYDNLLLLAGCYEKIGNVNSALKTYQTAGEIIPHKLFPKYMAFKLFIITHQDSAAIQLGNILLSYDEKYVTTASLEIKENIKKDLFINYRIQK